MSRTLITEQRLVRDLSFLDDLEERPLMVHSSLSAMGWVLGGAPTVVRALITAIGPDGTLVMPAATPQCGEPSTWLPPGLPADWLGQIRRHLPCFHRGTTPTTLGAIPETFRTWPGTLRSEHPLESVCARGPLARDLLREHPLAFSEGVGSPFHRLHELDGRVLLLGVRFNRCTALHYAESRSKRCRTTRVRFPLERDGARGWLDVPNVADDNDTHFPRVGAEFEATGQVAPQPVGTALGLYFAVRDLVSVATAYFDRELPGPEGGS